MFDHTVHIWRYRKDVFTPLLVFRATSLLKIKNRTTEMILQIRSGPRREQPMCCCKMDSVSVFQGRRYLGKSTLRGCDARMNSESA